MSGRSARKILGLAALRRRLAQARRSGLKVALANGCFDLLHAGHVRYLEDAGRRCDVLVVGVNSDRSVRRYKGPGRPVQPEGDRAEIVAALECVDYVTIFGDSDVHGLLRALRPDFHCKGTDYTRATVPERETAKEIGAKVLICGDPKDHSTRHLLARIARGRPRR
ncbi:MAG: adenylyltransferase/cytidyltransferase family protein [Acidobacteriota bacterium]